MCERENKFKFIFTPVYWGEKINSNLSSLPFLGEIFLLKFIFAPIYWGEKRWTKGHVTTGKCYPWQYSFFWIYMIF